VSWVLGLVQHLSPVVTAQRMPTSKSPAPPSSCVTVSPPDTGPASAVLCHLPRDVQPGGHMATSRLPWILPDPKDLKNETLLPSPFPERLSDPVRSVRGALGCVMSGVSPGGDVRRRDNGVGSVGFQILSPGGSQDPMDSFPAF
jgi:hypothetical protein